MGAETAAAGAIGGEAGAAGGAGGGAGFLSAILGLFSGGAGSAGGGTVTAPPISGTGGEFVSGVSQQAGTGVLNPGSALSASGEIIPTSGQGHNALFSQLGQLLSDPAVLKALGKTATHLSGAIGSANELGPRAAGVVQSFGGGGGGGGGSDGTFLGDAAAFTPQQAATVLQLMGFPSGFQPLIPQR